MTADNNIEIILLGNPNSGKSSLFNHLTGLNQKIGNFPGVTVEKRLGYTNLPELGATEVLDLPGIYSIYPRSLDERIVTETLLNTESNLKNQKIIVVVDATNIKRGLLLLTQVLDLGLPAILVLNMMDLAAKAGVSYDFVKLSKNLGVPVVPMNARKGEGIEVLRKEIIRIQIPASTTIFPFWNEVKEPVSKIRKELGLQNDYLAYQYLDQPQSIHFISKEKQEKVSEIRTHFQFQAGKFHGAETIYRFGYIQDLLNEITIKQADYAWKKFSLNLDSVFTHKIWGYAFFFCVLFLVFQAVFAWAAYPMDFIDSLFAQFSSWLSSNLPSGAFTRLLAEGIVPGLGGIVMFVPQIAILFAFIAVLEETGYMARVVFLMDKIMRKFGLNGKSIVPLISGMACAIPAIMATRTIDNWKERTITIFVTPLMSCSARLPIFTILIALIIPNTKVVGFFNLQGLALMLLYLLGFLAAIFSAWLMKKLINAKERSYLIMELPTYRLPKGTNVALTIIEKTKSFVVEAGKVILAISIVLWVLASYGPGDKLEKAEEHVMKETANMRLTEQGFQDRIAAYKLENSYAGVIGKAIEPAIKPLGYDWKIGIALLTSFAAREVFVGTMATIYSIGSVSEADENTIKRRMKAEVNPITGEARFTLAVGLSLLVFYTFAMQCMSTIAVVYRETKGWKWPLLQLMYMSALAYLSALLVYQILK